MKRLTRKTMFGDYATESIESNAKDVCINKLGQLEDIEEKLGIDLIEYFKNKTM